LNHGGEQSVAVALAPATLGVGVDSTITLAPVALTVAAERPSCLAPASPAIEGASRVSLVERCFDLALTIILLPLIALVGAAIALAIYIDSPGPVIYRSWRVGKHGVPFAMLKFRKMRADAGTHPLTVADDERFTPIGRFLAATRLDELPQVWNVLRGEMRLVGPRPEVEYFVAQFEDQYAEILTATPGITGVAQLQFVDEKSLLHGPDPAATYRDHVLPEKIKIDLAYVRSRRLSGDLMILARTLVLPANVFLGKLRARSNALRVWLPTAASAAVLVLMFVVTSAHLS
jgi:lipopolysaccharide/colanic/teichoic acid biosynthesis glycosyltransferase